MSCRGTALAVALAAAMLGGCASTPISPSAPSASTPIPAVAPPAQALVTQFSLTGRVAVRYEEQGFSANLRWQHAPQSDDLLILSPLGQGLAQVTRDGAGVTLQTADRRQIQAADAEQLTQQALGWRLPLKGLGFWAVGAPAPGAVSNVQRDGQGRLSAFEQEGWHIAYANYQMVDGFDLPTRIELTRPNLEIKLIVDAWQAPKI